MTRSATNPCWLPCLLLVAGAADLHAQKPPYDVFPPAQSSKQSGEGIFGVPRRERHTTFVSEKPLCPPSNRSARANPAGPEAANIMLPSALGLLMHFCCIPVTVQSSLPVLAS
jgi:hypothetical protein